MAKQKTLPEVLLVDKIVKSIQFLNEQGYIVSKGRSNSPQLKNGKNK